MRDSDWTCRYEAQTGLSYTDRNKSSNERTCVRASERPDASQLHLLSICLQLTCSPLQLQLPPLPPSLCISDTVTSSSLARLRTRDKALRAWPHMCPWSILGNTCVHASTRPPAAFIHNRPPPRQPPPPYGISIAALNKAPQFDRQTTELCRGYSHGCVGIMKTCGDFNMVSSTFSFTWEEQMTCQILEGKMSHCTGFMPNIDFCHFLL